MDGVSNSTWPSSDSTVLLFRPTCRRWQWTTWILHITPLFSMDQPKGSPTQVDWQADSYWRNRRLSPAQIQVHDIRLEGWRTDVGAMLEMKEILSSTLLPDLERRDDLINNIPIDKVTKNRSEQNRLRTLAAEYGWMNCLRSDVVQESIFDPPETRKCRWIHISSKFSDYLSVVLLALSDWSENPSSVASALERLDHCIYQNERFSKHGRYFAPFYSHLSYDDGDGDGMGEGPMLLSVPFLDWTLEGQTPPLRFQVDPREGYQSSRSSSHLLRSILQHFYRLEDTTDRESQQVFTKHKPWQTDRNLDLKVRRWYGYVNPQHNVPAREIDITPGWHFANTCQRALFTSTLPFFKTFR